MTEHDGYYNAMDELLNDNLPDLDDSGTVVRCALLTDSYSPDLENDETFADVSGDEVPDGDGYSSDGTELTNKSLSVDSSGRTVFDADDAVWENSTIDARYAVVYEESSDVLLTLVDFEEELSSQDGDFRVEWHSDDGVFNIQA